MNAPRGGSSHYTFRKEGCMPIFRYTDEKRVQICQCLREAQQQIEQLVGLYNFELLKP